ncbi:MAG: hypothetical protein PHQ11_07350 [Paludibacter sp.]|nr:hypothetical protein [Paludibacter sp.]
MFLFTPLFKTIDHFKERNYEAVASVATDLLNSSPESNQELIKQSIETITLFSFANKENSERIGQEMIDLLFELIEKHRSDFDTTTLLHFKEEIFDLTYEWIRRNKLRKSLKRYPEIIENCFVFCLYNYVEVVRREKE